MHEDKIKEKHSFATEVSAEKSKDYRDSIKDRNNSIKPSLEIDDLKRQCTNDSGEKKYRSRLTGAASKAVVKEDNRDDVVRERKKIGADEINPEHEEIFKEQIKESEVGKDSIKDLKKSGLLKYSGQVLVEEAETAIGGSTSDDIGERAKGVAGRGLIKTTHGTFVLGSTGARKYRKHVLTEKQKEDNLSPLEKKKLAMISDKNTSVSKSLSNNLTSTVSSTVRNFQGSDDLGMETISKTKNAAIKTKRTAQAAQKATKATAKAVQEASKATAKFVVWAIKGIVSFLSAIAPVLLILLPIILVVVIVIAVVPSLSLKSTDEELSKTYVYITELDTDFNKSVKSEKKGADVYHFYINGAEIEESYFEVKTNADNFLAYLDSKYEDYALDKAIYGLLGGENVKTEIEFIHEELNSYTTRTYLKSEVIGWDPDTGDKVFETKTHKAISAKVQHFDLWLSENKSILFEKDEYELYELLQEVGVFTARKEIASPFPEKTFSVSKGYGYYLDESNNKVFHSAIDLNMKKGEIVYAGISGKITSCANGKIVISYGQGVKEVTYENVEAYSSVTVGKEISSGERIGRVGSSKNKIGTYLRVRYKKGDKEMCPYIFLEGCGNYGSGDGSDIVQVAMSQLGQVGGQPYWSYMGFGGRVEWCACFVSWCANQCGYIDSGVIFKHTSCSSGVATWRSKGMFQEKSSGYIPKAGDIIYFDYKPRSHLDSDHVGIVQSSDGSYVYTIEGNSGDAVRNNTWSLYHEDIKGYATPNYPTGSSKVA